MVGFKFGMRKNYVEGFLRCFDCFYLFVGEYVSCSLDMQELEFLQKDGFCYF